MATFLSGRAFPSMKSAFLRAVAAVLPISTRRRILYLGNRAYSLTYQQDDGWKERQRSAKEMMKPTVGATTSLEKLHERHLQFANTSVADQLAALLWPDEADEWVTVDSSVGIPGNGEGTIASVFHIGPHVLVPPLLVRAGADVHVIVLDKTIDFWRTRFKGTPELCRISFIEAPSIQTLRKAKKAALSGAVILVYGDSVLGSMNSKHVADFLGHTIHLPLGPASIAAVTRLPINPLVLHRDDDATYRLITLGSVDPPEDKTREAIVQASLQVLSKFEDYIKEQPEHWLGWQTLTELVAE